MEVVPPFLHRVRRFLPAARSLGGSSSLLKSVRRAMVPAHAKIHFNDLCGELSMWLRKRSSDVFHGDLKAANPDSEYDKVYGVQPVLSMLSSGRPAKFVMINKKLDVSRRKDGGTAIDMIRNIAHDRGVKVVDVPKICLIQATRNKPHQGVVAVADPLSVQFSQSLPARTAENDADLPRVWIAFDEVKLPMNTVVG